MNAPVRMDAQPVRTRGLVVFSLLLTLLVMCAATLLAVRPFDEAVRSDLQSRATTVAEALSADVARLADEGVPVAKLHGLEEGSSHFLQRFPELRYIVMADADGRRIMSLTPKGKALPAIVERQISTPSHDAAEGLVEIGAYLDLRRPILSGGKAIAHIHVGLSADFALTQAKELYADILVVFFIAALLITEVLLVALALNVNRPLKELQDVLQSGAAGVFILANRLRSATEIDRARAAVAEIIEALAAQFRAAKSTQDASAGTQDSDIRFTSNDLQTPADPKAIRLPLVFYLFGTELSRSFFPLYVKDLYQPTTWLSEDVAIALPMSLWVAALMMVTPLGGKLIERFGLRGSIAAGMAPTATGLAITALAQDFVQLCIGRIVTAMGFGIVTVSAILFISRGASGGRSTRDMSVFVGASATASICGVSIGGILSDHFGPRVTFGIAVGVVLLALAMLFAQVPAIAGGVRAKQRVTLADYAKILMRPRVTGFVLLAAMPVRLILTGFLFYTTPLRLASAGFSDAATGRAMMAYFVAMSLATPLVAWASDRWSAHKALLVAAGLTSGAGACLFGLAEDTALIVSGVALVGLGQALASAPLLALTAIQFPEENERFGPATMVAFFRIVERIGSISGPLVAAALVAAGGFGASSLWFGAIMVSFSLCLALFFVFDASKKGSSSS